MWVALRIEAYVSVVVEFQSHRSILCDAFQSSQFAIRNLQTLTGCSELNAVAGGEHFLLFAIYRDAHLPARIVGCLLPAASKNCELVFFSVHRDNAGVFSLIDACLARTPRVAKNVVN